MLAKVLSSAVIGVNGHLIDVEVDLAAGLPSFSTVGLPEAAVRESKDRVRAALKNGGYEFPPRRITVNLAPATLKKEGAGYDLPIALGILAASGIVPPSSFDNTLIIGELSLDGVVKPVHGILPMLLAAKENGIRRFLVPSANSPEAGVIGEVDAYPVDRLDQAVEFLRGIVGIEPVSVNVKELFSSSKIELNDFSEVFGHEYVKRAFEVAAAGGHNLLMVGSPGCGKSMMAKRLSTILPTLTIEESIETTAIYSSARKLPENRSLLVERPYRSPHHTISYAGLIGGGNRPRPGEVSLAHNGVLFLDELPEFKRDVLEVLRQPLEDGTVVIARASGSLAFPASFMLIAAMNPCPCGYHGDPSSDCICTPVQVQRYRSRISGPLLDRIDIHIRVPVVPHDKLYSGGKSESSAAIRERVTKARERQHYRLNGLTNASMRPSHLERYCRLDQRARSLLNKSANQLSFSARTYARILKLSRTIADLDQADSIQVSHMAEAIQYRRERF